VKRTKEAHFISCIKFSKQFYVYDCERHWVKKHRKGSLAEGRGAKCSHWKYIAYIE
jgi:hypothetical protein